MLNWFNVFNKAREIGVNLTAMNSKGKNKSSLAEDHTKYGRV